MHRATASCVPECQAWSRLESNVPAAPLVQFQCARTGHAAVRGWPFDANAVADVIVRNAEFRATLGLPRATVAIVDDGLETWGSEHFPLEVFARNGDVAGDGDSDQNHFTDDDIGTNIFTRREPRAYYDPQSGMDSDHGTRMAGLALGGPQFRETAAQRGIEPLVRLLIVSIVKKEQTAASLSYRMPPLGIYEALGYLKDRSARVANLSVTTPNRLATLPTLTAVNKEILLVVAAGNQRHNYNDSLLYPGSFGGERGTLSSQVLTVAAHGEDGCLTSFSGYGDDAVDIAAPGVDIPTNVRGGTLASSDGTSQATALVSFVATHLVAAGLNSPLKIKERLRASVDLDPALSRAVFFGGTLNIPKALSVYHDVVETEGAA